MNEEQRQAIQLVVNTIKHGSKDFEQFTDIGKLNLAAWVGETFIYRAATLIPTLESLITDESVEDGAA